MRWAGPATLRLSEEAYAWLLRAYPASFRAEYGAEMALVFSDCCRAAWASDGARGIWRQIGRTVLDVLASAPPLWAERVEEIMQGNRVLRSRSLWLIDHGLAVGGVALLVLGATSWPLAVPLGWSALGLAFFAWVAEAEGFALPRPGRAAIRTRGCWETPLDFTVQHGNAVLLFVRDEEPHHGGWAPTYTVLQRRDGAFVDPRWELPLVAQSEWSRRGQTPVATLSFQHHERVSYVTRRSLERSLASAAV